MKILHVIDQISQTKHGGSAKVPYQLAVAQVKLGHTVTIFASDHEAEDQEAPKGVELVKFKTLFSFLGQRVTPGIIYADFGKFDIVHLHNYRTFQNLIASDLHAPYVLQAHGTFPLRGKTKFLHDIVWHNLIYNNASRLIADSPMAEEQYVLEGAKRDKIVRIPVGLDLSDFENLPPRQTNGFKNILFLGRIHKIKGLDLLIKAFAKLSRTDVRLQIAGMDYGHEAECRKLVLDLGISNKVNWLGSVFGKAKLQAYVNADIFVMSSRSENWGITFMEALACGTPVIMTDRCGPAPDFPRECGTVVPFDEQALAMAINTMLKTEDNRYREYRKAWVVQFDWINTAKKLLRLYEEVLSESQS